MNFQFRSSHPEITLLLYEQSCGGTGSLEPECCIIQSPSHDGLSPVVQSLYRSVPKPGASGTIFLLSSKTFSIAWREYFF